MQLGSTHSRLKIADFNFAQTSRQSAENRARTPQIHCFGISLISY
jgi:hypothetical protein